MCWYVLRTITGYEDKALRLLEELFKELKFIFPKRRLSWRKKGKIIEVIKPLFTGYIFVIATKKQIMNLDFWLRINRLNIWIVKNAKDIFPITSEEVDLIKKLTTTGNIVERSDILNKDQKVSIVKGPLVGLEGSVKKYSKRDRRVTITVKMAGVEKYVDLEGRWLN